MQEKPRLKSSARPAAGDRGMPEKDGVPGVAVWGGRDGCLHPAEGRRHGRFQPRDPPDSFPQLHGLPRPGRKETRGRAAAGHAGHGHRAPRRPSGHHAGRPQAKRTRPPREQRRCRRADAPAIDRQAADRPGDRSSLALDSPGAHLHAALGLRQAGPAAGAAGRRSRVAQERHRSLPPGPLGKGEASSRAGGRPQRADPAALARSDRPAADDRRGRRSSSTTSAPTPTNSLSIACWPARPSASTGPACGSTWPAMPIRPAT